MNVLRVITYVLTSLASALFIVVVIYSYVQINNAINDLQGLFPSAPSFPGDPAGPPAGSSGEEQYCFFNPDDPTCND